MERRVATYRAKVTEGGRIVIPAEIRRELGFQPGVEIVLTVAEGELRIRSVRQAIERARELVRRHVDESTSLADELISERHEAARLE
jgi:AbrB family looped-hinge helix DNA binding protein